jgi:hypothetical protein
LASVFEVDIDSIPFFEDMARHEWRPALRLWVETQGHVISESASDPVRDDYYLVVGISMPQNVLHCVVYRAGALVHDPLPGGNGLADTQRFWTFTPLPA